MPAPVYQRVSRCERASTAMVLGRPYLRYGSALTAKPAYPFGRCAANSPLMNTIASR
jgi:hypothetical protein